MWTMGPLLLRGEFLLRRDEVARPSTGVRRNLDVLAWSAVASWMLTGEDQAVDRRVPPATPVDFPGPGWGSLDVHVRAAGAVVDKDALEALGTDLARYTNRLTTYAFGFNWWSMSNVRISLEGILEDYHQSIAVNSAAEASRSLTGILMRFQIDF
jgi:phosphate-selective porin